MKKLFYWHIHHEVLVEPLTEPLKNRIDYIKKNKPQEEVAVRLKLLKPVVGRLPKEVISTWEAYGKALEACDKAREAYFKARDAYLKARESYLKAREAYDKVQEACDKVQEAYGKALKANMPAIEALHKKECKKCPWDGHSIFPNKS